jgi:hypothetical protein
MHVSVDSVQRSDMQGVLRTVGAMLDLLSARSVIIRESGEGLLVRARVAVTLDDRIAGHWTPLERALGPRTSPVCGRRRSPGVARATWQDPWSGRCA